MRRTLLSIISFLAFGLLSNQVLAQCDPPSQLPSEPFCTGAPSPCLEGTCFSTGGSTSGGGTDFCGPGTGLQNPQYFQFIASATTVVFNITVTCNSGSGLQLAIIDPPDPCTDWTAGNVLTCFNGLAGPGIVTVGGLVVGQTYLFLIDGFSGAVCEYLFNDITGVEEPPSIPDMFGAVAGPDTICPGGTALFSVDWSDPNAYKYYWYVKEVASIKKITVQPPVGIDPSVSLTFPANLPEGDYTVCVYGYNGCDTTNNELCKIITLKKIVTVPVDTTVCKEKLPFKYVGAPPPNSNNTFNAPGTFPVKFKSAQGCDSIIQFTLDVPLFT
ncbi:MAG: hypothetical protein ABIV51_00420, partial [Saprospiraceae bacterium]